MSIHLIFKSAMCAMVIAAPMSLAAADTVGVRSVLENRRNHTIEELNNTADQDRTAFAEAQRYLEANPSKELATALSTYLQDPDTAVRTGAELILRGAAEKWPIEIVSLLELPALTAWDKALSDSEKDSVLRILAGVSRGGVLRPESLRICIDAINHGSEDSVSTAILALYRLRETDAQMLDAIHKRFLTAEFAETKRASIEFVAAHPTGSEIENQILMESLSDDWEINRQASALAVGKTKPGEAVKQILRQRLEVEPDETTKRYLRSAIGVVQ